MFEPLLIAVGVLATTSDAKPTALRVLVGRNGFVPPM